MKKLLLSLSLIVLATAGASAQSQNVARETVKSAVVSVYPYPASGAISINYEAPEEARVSVTLTDMSGRTTLLKADEPVKQGRNSLTYSMAGVPVGTYMLRIQAGAEITTAKVMIVE